VIHSLNCLRNRHRAAKLFLGIRSNEASIRVAYGQRVRRERNRRRKQFLWRISIFLLAAGGLVGLGYSAYQTGTLLAASRVTDLEHKVADLSSQLSAGRSENEHLKTSLAEGKQANLALQSRYDSHVPSDDLAELLGIARERLSQGVPIARLRQVLREAAVARSCDTHVTRKRFALQVGSPTPDGTAALLDGLVQINALVPNAAADPARTATIVIQPAWAGDPVKLTGLPARQDFVVNNLLLHLTVEASPMAGFAMLSLSTCGKG